MLLKRLYDLEILRRDMKKLSELGFKTNSNTIKLFKISSIVFSINIEILSTRAPSAPFFWM